MESSIPEDEEANQYRNLEYEITDAPSDYLSAGQRRRISRPSLYRRDTSEQRSSVLRAIFTPQASQLEEMAHSYSFVYVMIHPKFQMWQSQIFKKAITVVIVSDLIAFLLSTEESFYGEHAFWFRVMEGVTSTIFLIEYIARVTVCVENVKFGADGPIWGRLRWMSTYHAVIDLFATAPYFVQLATDWTLPKLSYLRIFRLLRILKTESYIRAFSACYRVVYFNREILSVAFLICFFLVIFCSIILYYLRPKNGVGDVDFDSIPSTLYLSLLILTGQDSFIQTSQELPWYTKIVVGVTGALSVGMYAIPVSLLTWGFEAEAERCARKARKIIKRAKSSSLEGGLKVNSSSSDDEYLKIIAKESSESSDFDGDKRLGILRMLTEAYMRNDYDGKKYSALAAFLENAADRVDTPPVGNDRPTDVTNQDVTALHYQVHILQIQVAAFNAKLDTLCNTMLESRRA